MNLIGDNDAIPYINFLLNGADLITGPNFNTPTTQFNSSNLDANGWPNNAAVSNLTIGGGFSIPSDTNFTGQYSFDGFGAAANINFSHASNGTYTEQSGVACGGVASGTSPNDGAHGGTGGAGSGWGWTRNSNGNWSISPNGANGSPDWCIPIVHSGRTTPTLINFTANTDPNSTGSFLKNWRWYQQADYADLAAGKVYRTAYKQPIVNMHPGAIRFMNWVNANSAPQIRFESRILPTTANLNSGCTFLNSPPYGQTSGTNQYTLASAAGMPATMQHGEVALGQVINVPTPGNNATVLSVSNANPGVVTTSTAHGFTTGQKVILQNFSNSVGNVLAVTGMTNLTFFPVTVTNIDATHFSIGIDTTSFGTYIANSASVAIYTSLNVGGRGDHPIVQGQGWGVVGAGLSPTNFQWWFVYDKNSAGIQDGAGNWVYGVWVPYSYCAYGVPLEAMVALVNELNAMLPPGAAPIHMWVNLPWAAMISSDADYTAASNYPVNMVKVILNGTNGWAGLCAACSLVVENANEWWNFGFVQTGYYGRQCNLRWSSGTFSPGGCSTSNLSDFGTFRTVLAFNEIRTSQYYNPNRIKFGLMGGAPDNSVNVPGEAAYVKFWGDPLIMTDPLWTWTTAKFVGTGYISGTTLNISSTASGAPATGMIVGAYETTFGAASGGTPGTKIVSGSGSVWTVNNSQTLGSSGSPVNLYALTTKVPHQLYDLYGEAPYFNPTTAFNNANFATFAAQWAADAGNAPAQEADCALWIAGFVGTSADGTTTIAGWNQFLATNIIPFVQARGLVFVNYEGAQNFCNQANNANCTVNGSQLTTSQASFAQACLLSQAWGTALTNQFLTFQGNPLYGLPGLYEEVGPVWGFAFNTFSGTTEGAGLGKAWTALGTINAGVKMIDGDLMRETLLGAANDNLGWNMVVGQ